MVPRVEINVFLVTRKSKYRVFIRRTNIKVDMKRVDRKTVSDVNPGVGHPMSSSGLRFKTGVQRTICSESRQPYLRGGYGVVGRTSYPNHLVCP